MQHRLIIGPRFSHACFSGTQESESKIEVFGEERLILILNRYLRNMSKVDTLEGSHLL
ncbi:hypothetical protein HBI56_206320 [Parastagonospora nodorum]|nr:hypothetical protein HBH53_205130 [Parastagonospora nodorum]KAH4182752.1 hypothetical protein HBH42_217450 [Parastagonospora nodorum]KAH5348635.1 hypothetical protein HBI33_222050 [Parastagonospora nodorum]KAH5401078.1 hypothetical protein HBI46_228250 [Parastagonospora nodorum]KAH5591118.1 hypothetical protein HBI45_211940 [Parastagonospora nodorum]